MTDSAIEDVTEFGEGEAAKAKRWINELSLSEATQETWLTRCRKIIRRYKDERTDNSALITNERRRFATLWSNIEVLKPAVYAKPPQAVVLRRFKDVDKLGRVASEVLERALNYSIDEYDFDWVMKQCRDENLLCGLGQTWVRYVPVIETKPEDEGESVTDSAQAQAAETDEDDEDATNEYLKTESVVCDHVNYADFGTNKARTWDEVRFVWRRVYMARDALKARFTEEVPGTKRTIGDLIPLDWTPEKDRGAGTDGTSAELFAKARIYEIWDLDTRKVYWVSKSYPGRVLDERDDPLGLKDFFPCPRPVMATLGPDSTIPVPDYIFYQDQAEEIDDLTLRIGVLTDSLRMVGFYAGHADTDMQNVFKSGNENKLIPVDSWAAFKESGGVRGLIEWVPIDMVVAALTACYESRKQLLDDVYQITGISDIMRGDTDPRETKGAQVLKSQWGSSRVRERQKELARFARDNLRIKAEIIAEKFSWQTLKEMTNVDLLTREEKQLLQLQIQLSQQPPPMAPQPPMPPQQAQPQPGMATPSMPPSGPSTAPSSNGAPNSSPPAIPGNIQDKLDRPTWEEVEQFLRNDALRRFRIDVETDSTIEPDAATDKQDTVEFVTAIGGMLQQSLLVVQAAPPMGELVGEMIKFAARRFNAGREMEDVIDRVMDKVAQLPPTPPEAPKGPDPQIEALKIQTAQQATQQKAEAAQLKAQTDAAKIQSDERVAQMEAQVEQMRTEADAHNARYAQIMQMLHEAGMGQVQRDHEAEQADMDREAQMRQARMSASEPA